MARKKKKAKPEAVIDLEDDELPTAKGKKGRAVEDEEDPTKPRARADVYFGLTLLTTLILIGAAVLLYYDQEDLKSSTNSAFNPPSVTAGPLGLRAAKQN